MKKRAWLERSVNKNVAILLIPAGFWEMWDEVRTMDTPTTFLCALWLLTKSQALCPSSYRSGVSGRAPWRKGSPPPTLTNTGPSPQKKRLNRKGSGRCTLAWAYSPLQAPWSVCVLGVISWIYPLGGFPVPSMTPAPTSELLGPKDLCHMRLVSFPPVACCPFKGLHCGYLMARMDC